MQNEKNGDKTRARTGGFELLRDDLTRMHKGRGTTEGRRRGRGRGEGGGGSAATQRGGLKPQEEKSCIRTRADRAENSRDASRRRKTLLNLRLVVLLLVLLLVVVLVVGFIELVNAVFVLLEGAAGTVMPLRTAQAAARRALRPGAVGAARVHARARILRRPPCEVRRVREMQYY